MSSIMSTAAAATTTTTTTTTATNRATEWKYWHSLARMDNVGEKYQTFCIFSVCETLCHLVRFSVVCNTPTQHNYDNNKYSNNSSEVKWQIGTVTETSGTFTESDKPESDENRTLDPHSNDSLLFTSFYIVYIIITQLAGWWQWWM